MAIRRRNKLWQADVVTPTGQRIRRSFPTKTLAQEFVKGHEVDRRPKKQPPQEQLVPPSVGTSTTRRSAVTGACLQKPSLRKQAPRVRPQSVLLMSPPSAPRGRSSSRARGLVIMSGCGTGSDISAVPSNASPVSRTSPVQTARRGRSVTRSLSASTEEQAPASDSCFYSQETQALEQRRHTAFRRRRLMETQSEQRQSGTAPSLFPLPADSRSTSAPQSPSQSPANPSCVPSESEASRPAAPCASDSSTRRKRRG